jgi:predicted AAA+ superfamily ATPase
MRRKALTYLQQWLSSNDRKPIVIRGARQVGKTWLIRELAKVSNKQLIELNFENTPQFASLFVSNDPQKIITNIESALNCRIIPEQTILFLDEIQAMPELLSKLRWFYEQLPQLAVASAGSLLEFTLAEHKFSMPVGRISYLHLEPLSFEEFLLAKQENKLYEYIQSFQWQDVIPELIHHKLLELFKQYIIIGGLPTAVASWIKNNSLPEVDQLHHELLATYRDDFNKYSGKIPTIRLEETLTAVPEMLGKKFIYSKVNQDIRTINVKNALELLVKAKLCHKVISTAANGIPLAAELNRKFFKVIGLDVGLISTALGLKLAFLNTISNVDLINKGAIAEQIVGQLLRTTDPDYIEPQLYYWVREQKDTAAKLDYVIQHQNKVVPIEVKAGSTGSLKSLHLFMKLKNLTTAIRVNLAPPNISPVTTKMPNNATISYKLISIPTYLLGQLHRLLEKATAY